MMFLRELTDKEIAKIRKTKDVANKLIKTRRDNLMAEIDLLKKQLVALKAISGHPLIIKAGCASICVNYDLLKKFERSFNKGDFLSNGIKIEGKSLIIGYKKQTNKGVVELFELPLYQVELLDGLPSIDFKG